MGPDKKGFGLLGPDPGVGKFNLPENLSILKSKLSDYGPKFESQYQGQGQVVGYQSQRKGS